MHNEKDAMKYDVFISYSRKDYKAVLPFVERLKANGVSLWMDTTGVESGDAFKQTIVSAILESAVVLFFSSKDSNASKWTAKEIGVAVSEEKKIIPIKLDNSKYNPTLLFDLVNLDYIEAFSLNTDFVVNKILSSINKKPIDNPNPVPPKPTPKPRLNVMDTLKKIVGSKYVKIGISVVVVFILFGFLYNWMDGRSTEFTDNSENVEVSDEVLDEVSDEGIYSSTEIDNGTRFTVNGVSFDMVNVEGGTFKMGSDDSEAYDDEKPVHSETVSTFRIGRTEVTQALWKAVMGSNPSNFEGDNLPVEQVSWNDCKTFISKLNSLTGENFRLPTEAEWEYAARGGNKSRGYKYSGSNSLGDVAWYDGNSGNKPHPVASKSPNELGIYDMSGNVWEWTSDIYGSYSSSSRSGSYRVYRGGSWFSDAGRCRVSNRYFDGPSITSGSLGFRLAF
jgi:formylglycine-generating enzyme required for sulfatase activity